MNELTHTVRPERRSDADDVRTVTLAAFGSHGDSEVTGEAEAALIDLLRSRGKAVISLVATATPPAPVETDKEERVVGHVLFSEVTVEADNPTRVLGLAPLSVHPDAQGRGVGTALVLQGLEACRAAGYDAVVVLGEPGYYGRFGFEKASEHGLANEYGADDAFMVLGLLPGVLVRLKGIARFAPEFGEVGA
jgi:putative acetyltransferase